MFTFKDYAMLNDMVDEQRILVQAAAYTLYEQISPDGDKKLSQKEFYKLFNYNCQVFADLQEEERAIQNLSEVDEN